MGAMSGRRRWEDFDNDQGPEDKHVAEIEIGIFKSGRRAYGFDDIAIVPSRRTRDPEDVDISWEIDAYQFELPLMASAMDGVVSPSTAIEVGQTGWPRGAQPRGTLDPLRGSHPALRRDPRAPRRKGDRSDATDVRRAGPARAGHPTDQGDEGGRDHHLGIGHPAEDRAVRPRSAPGRVGPAGHPGNGGLRRARLQDGRSHSTSSGSSASSRSR